MKIGNWELRKPWVRYVQVELEERFYNEIRKSIGEDIAKEILLEYDGDDREVWLTDCLSKCADIARGKK